MTPSDTVFRWLWFFKSVMDRLLIPAAVLATYVLVPKLSPGTGVMLAIFVILDYRIHRLTEKRF